MTKLYPALAFLCLILFPASPVQAQKCELSLAAFSLPTGSSGELHWNSGNEYETQPVQLSKRYFSKPLEVSSGLVRFFDSPITEMIPGAPPPQPLLTLTIAPEMNEAFVVIFASNDSADNEVWRHITIDGKGWGVGTLRVVNASNAPIGMIYGDERAKLEPGKHLELKAEDWEEPFPVKLVQLEPVAKLVFSSTWRLSQGRRELCFLSRKNGSGSIALRSLLVLD